MKSEYKSRKSTGRKLELRRETVRQLRDGELALVDAGGNGGPSHGSQTLCASACDGITCHEH